MIISNIDKVLSGMTQVAVVVFAALTILLSVSAAVPLPQEVYDTQDNTEHALEAPGNVTAEYVDSATGIPVMYVEFSPLYITGRTNK